MNNRVELLFILVCKRAERVSVEQTCQNAGLKTVRHGE